MALKSEVAVAVENHKFARFSTQNGFQNANVTLISSAKTPRNTHTELEVPIPC
jgi:hypothetical protein